MPKTGFNLLRPQVEPPTVWSKLYDYVVGTARVVVIFVELVVVVAFVWRIIIDVQSKNLDDEIRVKESIISTFAQAEREFKQIQKKTGAYDIIWTGTRSFTNNYAEINKYLPLSLHEFTIQLNKDTVYITGTANVSEIQSMEDDLNKSETFTKKIDNITSAGTSGSALASFSLRLTVDKLEYRKITDVITTTITPGAPSGAPVPTLPGSTIQPTIFTTP